MYFNCFNLKDSIFKEHQTRFFNQFSNFRNTLKAFSVLANMWRLVLFVAPLAFAVGEIISGPQLFDVSASPKHEAILHLESSSIADIWSALDGKTQIVVEPLNLDKVQNTLKEHGLEYNVVVNNLLDLIKDEEVHMNHKRTRRKRSIERMDWTSYHKLEDIEGYMGWLNATEYQLVTVMPVATTYEGRPVYVVKVSDPSSTEPKKKIWIEGGIHAREWISPAVTTFLLHQVVTSPKFRPLLQKTEWYFVPVANPDGYSYSFDGGRARMWRKNRKRTNRFLPNRCKGIDLNRNWSLKWGVGASSNPCSDTYKGTVPFSEPETEGIRRIMETEGPFDLFITFHSYGQSVLYPWGWTTEPPQNAEDLKQLGKRFVEAVRHASRGKTMYDLGGSADRYGLASGASDDWAYGALRIPFSYTIELRDNGRYGFLLPENQIVDTVQESTVGVYCMASYLSNIGVCARPTKGIDLEPRRANSRAQTGSIIFEN